MPFCPGLGVVVGRGGIGGRGGSGWVGFTGPGNDRSGLGSLAGGGFGAGLGVGAFVFRISLHVGSSPVPAGILGQ